MRKKEKVKVKTKKRKIKFKRVFLCLLVVILFVLSFLFIRKLPIKNIYIIGNNIVSDKEIIEKASLSSYPSFLCTSKRDIINNLEKNIYIKEVKVEKKIFNKVYIYVTENKVLALYNDKVLLSDGSITDNTYNIYTSPRLISNIDDVKDKYVKAFGKVEDSILLKISEVEYTPNEVDKERFALRMNDGNFVYITLGKIAKINKYNDIYSSLDGKKGIIYLDAGDYFEIKE